MKPTAIALGLTVLTSSVCGGITWEFEEGTQGWQVRLFTRIGGFEPVLDVEVEEGVLRIPVTDQFSTYAALGPHLISPVLDLDSGLFDRVAVRLRFVHPDPVVSHMSLSWTNELNERTPGWDFDEYRRISRFRIDESVVFTSEWQDIVFHPFPEDKLWEGKLEDIRLQFGVGGTASGYPDWVEIDRIVLTGVEEQLNGELPPPVVEEVVKTGRLFSPAQFIPLAREGLGEPFNLYTSPSGVVDLDGDTDLDLVIPWHRIELGDDPDLFGVVTVENRGEAGFRKEIQRIPNASKPNSLSSFCGAEDLNRDGYADVLFTYRGVYYWLSDEDRAYTHHSLLTDNSEEDYNGDGVFDGYPHAAEDFDMDGDSDLWIYRYGDGGLRIMLNDGEGLFSPGDLFVQTDFIPRFVKDVDGDGYTDIVWTVEGFPFEPRERVVFKVSPRLRELGLEETFSLTIEGASELDYRMVHEIGDFDGDGDLDLLFAQDRFNDWSPVLYRGLQLALNDGSNHLHLVPWLDKEIHTVHPVGLWDLNGDGLLDPVVVNYNPRSNLGVMVYLGRAGDLPEEEGQYPLPGQGGRVWAGDLDGDGDLDLAVTEAGYQGGGVYLLYNQSGNRTVVEERGTALPGQNRLGHAYPNPFNPGVAIPFVLGQNLEPVSLTIYNSLGQLTWRQDLGRRAAGSHRAYWDGQSGSRRPVSAGVYFYRLRAGDWQAPGKLVKLE